MDEKDIRLECLKVAHRFDHEAQSVIDRAKAFESYVIGADRVKRAQSKVASKKAPKP